MEPRVRSLGLGVERLGFSFYHCRSGYDRKLGRVLGYRVWGLEFGFWVLGFGVRVQGSGFRVEALGLSTHGFGFRV